jgi:hypothetical protein
VFKFFEPTVCPIIADIFDAQSTVCSCPSEIFVALKHALLLGRECIDFEFDGFFYKAHFFENDLRHSAFYYREF